MSEYLHTQRIWVGSMAAIGASVAMLGIRFGFPGLNETRFGSVSGRVTYQGQPVRGATICLDSAEWYWARGALRPDGSFEIKRSGSWPGVVPAHYRVHFIATTDVSPLPAKYEKADTSGLEFDVVPDWNHFAIDLQ
jgi:hypothetical protein